MSIFDLPIQKARSLGVKGACTSRCSQMVGKIPFYQTFLGILNNQHEAGGTINFDRLSVVSLSTRLDFCAPRTFLEPVNFEENYLVGFIIGIIIGFHHNCLSNRRV